MPKTLAINIDAARMRIIRAYLMATGNTLTVVLQELIDERLPQWEAETKNRLKLKAEIAKQEKREAKKREVRMQALTGRIAADLAAIRPAVKTPISEKLLTTTQVAEMLGLRPQTIRSWVCYRKIPFIKIGKSVRFEASVIRDFIASGRQGKGL